MSPELPIVSQLRKTFGNDLLAMAVLLESCQILSNALKLRCFESFSVEEKHDFIKLIPVSRGGECEGVQAELAWGELVFQAMSVQGGMDAIGICTAWFKGATQPVVLVKSMAPKKQSSGR